MNKITRLVILLLLGSFLPLSLKAQEQFSRELNQNTFVPKGQWITGVSVSYAQSSQNKYQFLVFENLSGDTYTFKVTPMLLYSFADNLAAGMKFGYTRTKLDLTDGSFILDSETTFDADNINAISQNFYAIGAFRNYISLGNTSRFGVFNELQLELGGGQSRISNFTGDGDNRHLTGTFERNFSLNIGLTPGFIMFLNNYSAIEVSVGVLGFGYTHTKAITDRVNISRRNSKHANFKINLFSVQFGMAFYL